MMGDEDTYRMRGDTRLRQALAGRQWHDRQAFLERCAMTHEAAFIIMYSDRLIAPPS
jgi:hypothetical protein